MAELVDIAKSIGLEFFAEVPDSILAPDLTEKIPLAWARAQCVLPVRSNGKALLLVSRPSDLESAHRASIVAGCPFETALADRNVIQAAIERCYASSTKADADEIIDTIPEPAAERQSEVVSDLLDDASAPATKLVNAILLDAVREGASDVHFEPFPSSVAVRFRIDGILQARKPVPKGLEPSLVSRLKIMAGMDISERRLPQDGMAQARLGDKSVDIRVSTVPVADGERVVLRLLNRADTCRPLTSLGMSETMLSDFRSVLASPNGIVIVSGPTGSGKTTTLYSALGEIDSAHRNILTIEDPVEYRLPNIGQIQIKPKIGLTFAEGLRHILRQDPDVVLVGETRDAETAEIAVRASLTGHLVFTTLHTNDAPSAVTRLVDMGIQQYLIASSLRGVLAQRLVRKLCPFCKAQSPNGFHAVGCDKCNGGYKGRTGIFELMSCGPAIREAIRSGEKDLRKVAVEAGMSQMADDARAKLLAGMTDASEIAGALSE